MSAGRDNKRLSASFQRPSRGVGRGGVDLRLANIAIGPSPSLRRRRHAIKRVRGTPRFAQPRSAPSHCSYMNPRIMPNEPAHMSSSYEGLRSQAGRTTWLLLDPDQRLYCERLNVGCPRTCLLSRPQNFCPGKLGN